MYFNIIFFSSIDTYITKLNNMAKRAPMTDIEAVRLRTLVQVGGLTVTEIMNQPKQYPMFQRFSRATLFRQAKIPIMDAPVDRRRNNKKSGRPRKLNAADSRLIKRNIQVLREFDGSFTAVDLQQTCGFTETLTSDAFRRDLKRQGYKWLATRRKGMLTAKDLKERAKFCRKVKRLFPEHNRQLEYWQTMAMYVDCVGFEYKSNPYEHAKSLGTREWRLQSEGLSFRCTSKGCKEGKNYAKFVVGISYQKGTVLCEPLTQNMNGQYFADLVTDYFPDALSRSEKPSLRVLQDGDPSQNSKKAKKALDHLDVKIRSIPARSPELNVIENLFNQLRGKIKKDSIALRVTRESKSKFIARLRAMIESYDQERIDNLINSMPKRVDMIIATKGRRIKY